MEVAFEVVEDADLEPVDVGLDGDVFEGVDDFELGFDEGVEEHFTEEEEDDLEWAPFNDLEQLPLPTGVEVLEVGAE